MTNTKKKKLRRKRRRRRTEAEKEERRKGRTIIEMPVSGKQGTPLRNCATPCPSPMKDTVTIDLKLEEKEEKEK